ncbi:MAG: class I SAM-dependent methyltransferase [Mycobacteriales bacterium]
MARISDLTPDLTPELARDWITRWDRQQEVYVPEREERFTVIADAVEAATGRPDPLIVDLGCGPGSLAVRLLARFPNATVVGVDADPLLLELATTAYADLPGLRIVDTDLRAAGWPATLGLDRAADAVVSTTALHWLAAPELRALYAGVHGLLRPGGVLLNGDHLRDSQPGLRALARELVTLREQREAFAAAGHEDWEQWWEAVAGAPELAPAYTERARRGYTHASESLDLDLHLEALRAAGFTEAGILWQYGDDRLLCARKP